MEGPLSLFYGYSAMLSKQIPYTISKQVGYEFVVSSIYSTIGISVIDTNADVKFAITLISAFLSSILACIASHPGDSILTRTYQTSDNDPYTNTSNTAGIIATASLIYRERGLKGFMTGISARFVHVGAIVTTQLVVYDFVKSAIGLPPTGS